RGYAARAASRAQSVVLSVLVAAIGSLRSLVRTRRELALESFALRQQLAILRRARPKRLRLKRTDRIFWAWLSSVGHTGLTPSSSSVPTQWSAATAAPSALSGVGSRFGRAQVARWHP